MPSQSAPEDDDVRQSYNFAPGYYGLVYRADVHDRAAGGAAEDATEQDRNDKEHVEHIESGNQKAHYKLQAMKWGFVPFWTKRNPDYGSMMKTINARDDSLASSGGMWQHSKQKKRCVIIAQGFYEWLKSSNSKEKIPHYVKRKDGQLMCFAGLWDCAQFEGSEEKLYTYTIITTDSNKQLHFLHDRMPVILDNGSAGLFEWLDSTKSEWDRSLQKLLQPYGGELECYPVTKEVGKVGNNSPTFIVPVNSKDNKQNIANFFDNQNNSSKSAVADRDNEADDDSNAPNKILAGTKHDLDENEKMALANEHGTKSLKNDHQKTTSPVKKLRSATCNASSTKSSPVKSGDGSKKITNFFNT